jgi:dipeptidyl aminopeptidase/acylaminoacyl peptidase
MKGEHVFSRTGKPSLRVKRLEHMLRWFKKYLMADE